MHRKGMDKGMDQHPHHDAPDSPEEEKQIRAAHQKPKRSSRRGRLKSKKARGALIAVIAVMCVLALLVISGGVYIAVLMGRIGRVSESNRSYVDSLPVELPSSYSPSDVVSDYTFIDEGATDVAQIPVRGNTKTITNYLLIGVDSDRDDQYAYTARSDTSIILTINSQDKTIKMTSMLRDMLVTIPGRDKDGDGKDDHNKFNTAYAFGGFPLESKMIEQNFRLKIDKYVAVNFHAFSRAVEALGGVDMALTDAEYDQIRWYCSTPTPTATPGVYHLNGDQALYYSRIRGIDSDFNRTDRQRKMLSVLFAKAKNMGIGTLVNLVNEIFPYLDTNMSNDEMLGFALNSMTYKDYEIKDTYYMPQPDTYDYGIIDVGWCMWFRDPAKAVIDLHKFIYN